ncbi:DegT/DnrJ/EryC1/StrS family aminotransferase [Prochlorococcus sp. AH-716-B04]|nr:DegT/DnrJ/EryC1/StrS family aminotransferase [Prochlorococcus sp. AH-716-B04]
MIPRFKPSIDLEELRCLFLRHKGKVKIFEKKFAEKFQAKAAISFPYGRSAQWAFLKALDIKDKEIIMPSYTCSVVAHSITLSGNKPIFVDINLNDFNMNLEELEKAISIKTKGIIATHTFGYPQDINKIKEIIKRAEERYRTKIYLINDCCHAFGAEIDGEIIGKTGDVSIYAFNVSKIITSIFGGMLTFQDESLARKVKQWRDSNYKKPNFFKKISRRLYLLGIFIAFNSKFYSITWWLQRKTIFLNYFTKSFHLDEKIHFPPDYLDFMLDVEAAIGLIQLKKYDYIVQKRREKALQYSKVLAKNSEWILPPIRDGATYSHFTVRVKNRKKVIDSYQKKGIELGELIQYSIPSLKCYEVDNVKVKFKNSEEASKTTINFPL